jgi:bifunctional DNase/RNase
VPTGPIHLHIADVVTAVPAQVGVEAGLVTLTEDEAPYRSLRIIIGQPEASAILAGWHGAVPGRPSTWDLFVSTVALLGGRMDRVVITAVHEERHYFAHIEFEQEGERRILACRPSDAIALAVRAYNVAILAEPSVLDAAGVLPDGTKPGRAEEEPGAEPDSELGAREAALAAREAELAERERLIAEREQQASPPATPDPNVAADPTDVAVPPVRAASTDPAAADPTHAAVAPDPADPPVPSGPVEAQG